MGERLITYYQRIRKSTRKEIRGVLRYFGISKGDISTKNLAWKFTKDLFQDWLLLLQAMLRITDGNNDNKTGKFLAAWL